MQRQNDGILEPFPIWDDVSTFDGKPWRNIVDVVSGGFPCQDISCAGKGKGIDGARSGLWKEMARIIGEVRPKYVFVENSPMLITRGLAVVLGDLAEMGYNARWCCISALDSGAPHIRNRIWILCYANGQGEPVEPVDDEVARVPGYAANSNEFDDDPWRYGASEIRWKRPEETELRGCESNVAHTDKGRFERASKAQERKSDSDVETRFAASKWWQTEPDVGRVANGVASRVDRLKAIGNGQVPAVAALAWEILKGDQ
jgi:DNA (cytosine-5)-methyltransferase 1